MSVRKVAPYVYDSSDNDEENTADDLNSGILMSYSERFSESRQSITQQSISITETQNARSKHAFGACSIERSISTVKSTNIMISLRDKNGRQLGRSNDEESEGGEQNKEVTTFAAAETELKVKGSKPRVVSAEILLEPINTNDYLPVDTDSKKEKNENISEFDAPEWKITEGSSLGVSPDSDKSSNVWENLEEMTTNNLDESNIWPALTVLETTFTKADGNTSKDHREIIEKLNEQFNYSPRSFTETLLTIIEESFVETEETPDRFLEALKRTGEVKLLENESVPKLVISQPSSEFTDISFSTKNYLHETESADESTKYMGLADGRIFADKQTQRPSAKLISSGETSKANNSSRSRSVSPANSSKPKKIYPKTPGLIVNREAPKISMSHRLRVGSASSNERTPRKADNRTFNKTPMIVVDPGTPQPPTSLRKRRQEPIKSWDDDDEYLTAESDTDQQEEDTDIEHGEPASSNSEKLDMSRIAFQHKEWMQTFEKVSKYKPVSYRNTSMITEKKQRLLAHGNKLEKRWMRELQQKRQKCFDLVERLLENKGERAAPAVEGTPTCVCTPHKMTMEFLTTLRACSEYFAYGMSGKETCESTTKPCQFVTSLKINLEKNKKPSPRLPIHHGLKKTPRRSLGKKTLMIKSPGAKFLSPQSKRGAKSPHTKGGPKSPYTKGGPKSPHAKVVPKQRSLKGLKTPVIDRSSIRPVAQLRCIFSPTLQAADGSQYSKRRLNYTKPAQSSAADRKLKVESRQQQKFKHVVSPIRKYIKGED